MIPPRSGLRPLPPQGGGPGGPAEPDPRRPLDGSASGHAPGTVLRQALVGDAAAVLAWRNHPGVRRVMFTDHLITPEEHAAWWQRVMASPDHRVLVVVHDGLDCGVVTFSRHGDEPDRWTWGFYLDPDAFGQPMQQLRAWSGMEQQSIDWAQHALQARRIDCEVFAFNAAVLALHKRHRFVEIDRYPRQRGDAWLEVVRLYRPFASQP